MHMSLGFNVLHVVYSFLSSVQTVGDFSKKMHTKVRERWSLMASRAKYKSVASDRHPSTFTLVLGARLKSFTSYFCNNLGFQWLEPKFCPSSSSLF
jgi:hypothetical protein